MSKNDWRRIGWIAMTTGVCIAAAGIAYAASGGGHGEGDSSKKLMDLLYRTLNFAGLAAILFFTLKKPIVNGLNRRREEIRARFEDLDARKMEAESLYKEYENKLARIEEEAKKIIDAAVAQGEAEKERIINDAKRAAGDISRQAEMAVQQALAEAKKELRQEIAEQAVAMAEDLIRKNLRPSDHINLVDNYLNKVGGLK